jgi:hypothetical protein
VFSDEFGVFVPECTQRRDRTRVEAARPRRAGRTRATHRKSRSTNLSLCVYVLYEPATGLHLADLKQLLGLLDRLVDAGKSVIVIEHHQSVMAHADWIIDLGPGAGHEGGKVVFEGTPADLVAAKSTLTGKHPAAFVGSGAKAVASHRPWQRRRQARRT